MGNTCTKGSTIRNDQNATEDQERIPSPIPYQSAPLAELPSKPNSPPTNNEPPQPPPEKEVLNERARRRLSLASVLPMTQEKAIQEERGQVVTAARDLVQFMEQRGPLEPEDPASRPRLSIAGANAAAVQCSYERKVETLTGGLTSGNLELYGIGHACRKGLKPESPNQDDFFIYLLDNVRMFGVFDGHGPYGDDVSNFVQQRLGRYVWEHPDFGKDYKKVLTECFARVQKEIEEASAKADFDANLSGCTGTLVIHDVERELIISAHVGDSRAVLATKNSDKPGDWTVKDLTEDHKPTLPEEHARIVAAGGQVKRLVGDIPHRVFIRGKQIPGLAMSRAFGDFVAALAGVIAVPEVNFTSIPAGTEAILIVCSDGVWEFHQSAEAFHVVQRYPKDQVQLAAEALAKEAWNRWRASEGDVVDDITVEIAYLAS